MFRFIIFLLIFSFNFCLANEFATINYEKIFQKSTAFQDILKKVDNYKKENLKKVQNIEKELLKQKTNLDESQMILSNEEFNKKIIEYENNVNNYQIEIDKINNNIYLGVENSKKIIVDEVNLILKDIANEDNISIIFKEDDYAIADKDIDLSNRVIKILNNNLKELDISEF